MNKSTRILIDILFPLFHFALGFVLFYGVYYYFVKQTGIAYSKDAAILFPTIAGAIWCLIGNSGSDADEKQKKTG